jgi:hypothetical protein
MGPARRFQPVAVLSVVAGLAVLLGTGPVLAQTPPPSGAPTPPAAPAASAASGSVGMGVVAPTPGEHVPDFGFEWGIPPEQQGAREQEFYPMERVPTIHQPAFLRGATKTTRTSRTSGVRWGLSGWTAPRIPFDLRESSGGAAFGLSIEWGTPLEPPAEPTPPTQR